MQATLHGWCLFVFSFPSLQVTQGRLSKTLSSAAKSASTDDSPTGCQLGAEKSAFNDKRNDYSRPIVFICLCPHVSDPACACPTIRKYSMANPFDDRECGFCTRSEFVGVILEKKDSIDTSLGAHWPSFAWVELASYENEGVAVGAPHRCA